MNPAGDLWQSGPTGGVAATILAIGSAVLLVAWKALPLFREWAAAIHEVRGIGARAAARLDDLIEDHGRLRADVARILQLTTEPDRGPTMPDPTRPSELAAVTEVVKHELRTTRPAPAPGQLAGFDLEAALGFLGNVDQVVAKLYPILAPLLPGNVAGIAAVIFQVLQALAHRPPGTSP